MLTLQTCTQAWDVNLSSPVAGAPLILTEDLIKTFNISTVVRGTVTELHHKGRKAEEERYAYPKAQGIFRCVWPLLV